MKCCLFAGLIFLAMQAVAAPTPVASFTDPAGDDSGAGNLLYPMSPDYQEGDLDLRAFSLLRDSDGFWFEAGFANPVRSPSGAFSGGGADSLSDLARRGFYTFNIDVYVDTDRRKDSGNTFALPGRKVRIDGNYAWEKAVILTPRPELMRIELLDALQRQYPSRSSAELEDSIGQSIFFPERIRVRGKTIAFFVPQSFFGSGDGSDWAMSVLVTGAKPFTTAGGGLVASRKTPLEELEMGVLQPVPGRTRATFGYTGRTVPSPVVDALLPGRDQQMALLGNLLPLTGVSWGRHAGNDAKFDLPRRSSSSSGRPDGVVEAASGGALGFLRGWFGDSSAKTPKRSGPVPPVRNLLDPRAPREGDEGATGTAVKAPATVQGRLQTLKQLLDDGLISEAEFNKHKQRILGDL